MIGTFQKGDRPLNKWDLPIEIIGVESDYYIGLYDGKWVETADGKLTPYQEPAGPTVNGDEAARPSANGKGQTPKASPIPRFHEGDKVNIVIREQLQTLEPATVTGIISPVAGVWGYYLRMADGSEGIQAETNLEPAESGRAAGNGAASGALLPSSMPMAMSDLLSYRFNPQEFLVEGLFAKGHLVILGGRPKGGKSWLALQLAQCVDTGADFLGRETMKAKVLLYALEDGQRRVQARAKAIGWQPKSAAVLFTIPYLDDGQGGPGPGILEIWEYTKHYDLIVIDTLITAMSGRTDERDNSAMGSLINALADVAHQSDKAIVIIHHTGKAANQDDIFATLRGASAIRGGYDVGLILERKPGEREAILHAESRDLDIRNMTLRQAEGGVGWEFMGDANEIEKIRAGRKVLDALLEHDATGDGLTAKQLAEIRKVSEATIGRQLTRLEVDGYVSRDEQPSTQMGKKPDIWRVKSEFLNTK